jgi:hypothetical protein
MRFRVTVRGEDAELRGHIDGTLADLNDFAESVKDYGWVVVASPIEDGSLSFIEQDDLIRARAKDVVRTKDANSTLGTLFKAIENLRAVIK